MFWQTSRGPLDLNRPKVMGIVNLTPDSFSDGSRLASTRAALAHCAQLVKDGVDILDIGGESTRPGALPVPIEEELSRVMPVLKEAVTLGVPVSIDTYKPWVMQAALDVGVDIVNDVWALRWRDPAAGPNQLTGPQVIARHPACGVCLMHMHGEPFTMQQEPMVGDVFAQLLSFWEQQVEVLSGLGVEKRRIVLDPGIGFGKTMPQNFMLLSRQRDLLKPGYPLLVGWSRKSSLAAIISTSLANIATLDNQGRLVPSVAAALLAVERGASIVRVHDVRETVQALKVLAALR